MRHSTVTGASRVLLRSEAVKHFPFFIPWKPSRKRQTRVWCFLIEFGEWYLIFFRRIVVLPISYKRQGKAKQFLTCLLKKLQPREPCGKVYTLQPFFCFTNRPQNHQTMAQIFLLFAPHKKKKLLQSYFRLFLRSFHSSIYAHTHFLFIPNNLFQPTTSIVYIPVCFTDSFGKCMRNEWGINKTSGSGARKSSTLE